jgi:hypothetical protein
MMYPPVMRYVVEVGVDEQAALRVPVDLLLSKLTT